MTRASSPASPGEQTIQPLEHVRHRRRDGELAYPTAHFLDVGVGMCGKKSCDIVEILWPMRDGLHDEKVFNPRQADGHAPHGMYCTALDRGVLEWQTANSDVEVDRGRAVAHQ